MANLLEKVASNWLLEFLDARAKDEIVVQLASLAKILRYQKKHVPLV